MRSRPLGVRAPGRSETSPAQCGAPRKEPAYGAGRLSFPIFRRASVPPRRSPRSGQTLDAPRFLDGIEPWRYAQVKIPVSHNCPNAYGKIAPTTMKLPPFSDLIEQAPDGVVIVDLDGKIVFANARMTDLFGFAPGVLVGRPIEALLPARFRCQHTNHRLHYSTHLRVRPMGNARSIFLGARIDGSEFPVEIQLAPIQKDSHTWTVAFVRDATDHKTIRDELERSREAAEDVARLKGEFLSLAAHDLCQPVQTLEFVISSIRKQAGLPDDAAELADIASSSLTRMRELLKMLLDISRIESGTIQVMELPIPVVEIFDDLERQFGADARAKNLEFRTHACARVLATDPGLLRAILSNLTANAIRYTPRGGVSIDCAPAADGGVRLAVHDTGIGIPPEKTQVIFDDFYRVSDAKTTGQEGFGLGLGIVRRLSTILGFPVTVESVVGRGSTFAVHVPKERVHAGPCLQ